MKLSTRVKLIVVLSVVIVMLASFAYAAFNLFSNENSPQNAIIGTWVTNVLGNEIETTFSGDGAYSERSGGLTMNGTYSVEGNRITAIIPGYARQISEFEITGNELTTKVVYTEINGVDVTSTMQSMTFTYTKKSGGDFSQEEKSQAGVTLREAAPSRVIDWIEAKGMNIDDVFSIRGIKTLPHLAAEEGRVDVLELLYELNPPSITEYWDNSRTGYDVTEIITNDWTPIHFAAFHGQVEVMKWLMEHNVDINTTAGWGGWFPIHCAAFGGQVEAMKWLMEQGTDINTMTDKGVIGGTPMHVAASAGHVEVMKWLKEQGADMTAERAFSGSGFTAMYAAVRSGQMEAMKWLREQGVELPSTIMCTAVRHGHIEAMKWLEEQGADVNATIDSIWPPMHYAAINGDIETMKWLKEQGASVTVKINSATLMHSAAFNGQLEVMKWLKEQGVGINEEGILGTLSSTNVRPIHMAASGGYIEIIKWLKEQGVDINARDDQGRTPLDVARGDDLKRWLIQNGAR